MLFALRLILVTLGNVLKTSLPERVVYFCLTLISIYNNIKWNSSKFSFKSCHLL